jgi:hypothetical protein
MVPRVLLAANETFVGIILDIYIFESFSVGLKVRSQVS